MGNLLQFIILKDSVFSLCGTTTEEKKNISIIPKRSVLCEPQGAAEESFAKLLAWPQGHLDMNSASAWLPT